MKLVGNEKWFYDHEEAVNYIEQHYDPKCIYHLIETKDNNVPLWILLVEKGS